MTEALVHTKKLPPEGSYFAADWSSPGDLFGSSTLDDQLHAGACLKIVVMALSVRLWASIWWVVASPPIKKWPQLARSK
jgi:hypothetical protein